MSNEHLRLKWLTLSGRRPLSYANCSANQWTDFCMITASVIKDLKVINIFGVNLKTSLNFWILGLSVTSSWKLAVAISSKHIYCRINITVWSFGRKNAACHVPHFYFNILSYKLYKIHANYSDPKTYRRKVDSSVNRVLARGNISIQIGSQH